jgi:hypothetical protein
MKPTRPASLLALIAAFAIPAVSQIAAAEAAEETFGAWRVMCENKTCVAYQYGVGGSAPVILRVKRGIPPAPEMLIEGGPFGASGLVKFIIDGKDIGGGPAAPGREGEIDTIVLESDDITLGLSRQMKKATQLTIEVPTTKGAETIDFGLDGYSAAMDRVEASPD